MPILEKSNELFKWLMPAFDIMQNRDVLNVEVSTLHFKIIVCQFRFVIHILCLILLANIAGDMFNLAVFMAFLLKSLPHAGHNLLVVFLSFLVYKFAHFSLGVFLSFLC
jgi:hypothetical protein